MVTESDKKKFVASSAFIKKDNKKEVESNANKDFLFSDAKFLKKEKPKDSLTVSTDAEIERVDNNDKIILQNIQKDNFSQIKVKNNSIKNKIETKYLKTTSSDKKVSKQKSDILLTTIEESESKSSTMHHLEPGMKEDPLSNEKLKTRPSETTSEPTSIKKNNSNNVSKNNKQINKAHYEKKLGKKALTFIGVDYIFQSEMFFDPENTVKQAAYQLINGRVGVNYQNFEVSVWAKNLNDEVYFSYGYGVGGAASLASYGLPRTYGFNTVFKF